MVCKITPRLESVRIYFARAHEVSAEKESGFPFFGANISRGNVLEVMVYRRGSERLLSLKIAIDDEIQMISNGAYGASIKDDLAANAALQYVVMLAIENYQKNIERE